jgi:hypothetical protein
VQLELMAPPELRARREFLESLDLQVPQAQPELLVQPELREPQERPVLQERPGQRVRKDQSALLARREPQEQPAQLAQQATWVRQAQPGQLDRLVNRSFLSGRGIPAQTTQSAKPFHFPDRATFRSSTATSRTSQIPTEEFTGRSWLRQASQEQLERMVQLGQLAQQAHRELPERAERLDPRGRQVRRGQQVRRVSLSVERGTLDSSTCLTTALRSAVPPTSRFKRTPTSSRTRMLQVPAVTGRCLRSAARLQRFSRSIHFRVSLLPKGLRRS